jgi:aldose 1-epimerase
VFTIKTEPFGKFTQIKLINTNTGEYVGIIPDYGAALNSLVLRKGDRLYDLIDGSNTYEELMEDGTNMCKGMVLFPFPNRITDGKYTFEGVEHQLDVHANHFNNAIHGLVVKSKFKVRKFEADDNMASLEIFYDETGQSKGYPFKSRLSIIFTLTDRSELVCKCIVESKDDKNLPVGVGWHPYFKALDKVDALELKISSDKIFEVDGEMIPTEKFLTDTTFNSSKFIADKQMDTCYVLPEKTGVSTVEITDTKNNAVLKIWQETGKDKYNFSQFYIPKGRNSIAVEPMTCAANAFNNGIGLTVLKPGEKTEFDFGVKLS